MMGVSAVTILERITIFKCDYERLLEAEKKLRALEEHGVDNWEWYGEAMSSMEDDE